MRQIKNFSLQYNKIIILLFFTINSIPLLKNVRYFYWTSIALIAVAFIWKVVNSNFKITNYLLWLFILFSYLTLTVFWAYDTDLAIKNLKLIMVILVVFGYVSLLIDNEKDIFILMKIFIFSKLIMAIYILFNIDTTNFESVRIGADVLGEEWNANSIGMNAAFSSMLIFFLFKVKQIKKIKWLYIVLLILFVLITVLSGSRKAFFILVFSITTFSILSNRKYKISKFIVMLSIMLFGLYLVINVPIFYEVLGSRLESLFAKFTGENIVDKSTEERSLMISYGLELFKERAMLGYGLNNFEYLYGALTGDYMYSHNNYIELLVGTGIIGVFIYYSSYIYIFKNSIFKKNINLIFIFVVALTFLIVDTGLVSYSSFNTQFLICILFSIIKIEKQKRLLLNYNKI